MKKNTNTMQEQQPPRFPSVSATPHEVRAYLMHVLTVKHSTDRDWAKKIVDKWQFARGSLLHELSEWNFCNIFGNDVGCHLYRTVREDLMREWTKSPDGTVNYWIMVISCTLSAYFLTCAFRACSAVEFQAPFERVCITFGIPMFIWAVRESSSLLTYSVLGLSILLDFYYAIHRISVIYGA